MSTPSFPLPPPTQNRFTEWFRKTVPNTDEIILYPGEQLPCSTRARVLKKLIKPKHVFITQTADGTFKHRLYGNENAFSNLPKRLYSVCFPKIHVSAVPKDNRITIQISDKTELVLPFIPDEFYSQKVAKAERHVNPEHRRTKRRRTQSVPTTNPNYRGWATLRQRTTHTNKYAVLRRIRATLDALDAKHVIPHNPFAACGESFDGVEDAFATVIQFIYHYARGEMRMGNVQSTSLDMSDDVWEMLIHKLTNIT
jgi:hypothetical protein